MGAFTFYAAQGGGDPYHLSLNAFTSFLDDAAIPDPESQYMKRSDCDTIFIVANFISDKKRWAAFRGLVGCEGVPGFSVGVGPARRKGEKALGAGLFVSDTLHLGFDARRVLPAKQLRQARDWLIAHPIPPSARSTPSSTSTPACALSSWRRSCA